MLVSESECHAADAFAHLPGEIYQYVVCSTAHVSKEDDALLLELCRDTRDGGDAEWVHFTGTGYLVRLSAFSYPLLALKRRGLSHSARRFIYILMTKLGVTLVHFDCYGEVLNGFDVNDW